MSTVASSFSTASPSLFRDVVLPKEHGSWSLALEPIALALLVAPSIAGGGLAVALIAGFFARRPWRISFNETRPARRALARRALVILAIMAGASVCAITLAEGVDWLVWLAPVAIAGGIFACFDRHGAGREEAAEVAGAAAFAMVPAAIGVLGGLGSLSALALALLALSRSVPSVLCVRSFLRFRKTGVRRDVLALGMTYLAFVLVGGLYAQGLVPLFGWMATIVFAVRASWLTIFRPDWLARTVGMMETVLGIVFVLGTAWAWHA